MPRKRSNKGRYNFLIDKDVYNNFSLICEELGLVRSKNLQNYIQRFVNQHKKLIKQTER